MNYLTTNQNSQNPWLSMMGIPQAGSVLSEAGLPQFANPGGLVPSAGSSLPIPGGLGGAGSGFGLNLGTANLALQGLSTLGGLWAAFKAQKLAKQQFKYTKNVTDTNLNNQIKSYNTTLEDRSRSRAKVEGMSPEMAQAYIDRNRLVREPMNAPKKPKGT
jgi:hypothetical protein